MRTPLQILIVEDERLIGSDLRRRLHRMGHAVVGLVASGEEAITQAHRLRPDLVLMDIRLRGLMDGVEAAQHIRAQCDIPVVFMSAYTTFQPLEHIWRTGPTAYLSKPFFESQLRLAIERALEAHEWRTRPTPRLRNARGHRPVTTPPGAAPQEKLRSLAMKAVENVEAAVQGGDLRASIEVLKAIGLYGVVAPTGEQEPHVRLHEQVNAEVAREGLDHDPMRALAINMNNPRLYQRKEEIEAELRARYLDHA